MPLGFFFSTDAVFNKITGIPPQLLQLWDSNECLLIVAYSAFLLLFFATIVLIGFSIFNLLNTIKSKIDTSDYRDAICTNNHKAYFNSICSIPYNTFNEGRRRSTNDERIEELTSQLYINSMICNSKSMHFILHFS